MSCAARRPGCVLRAVIIVCLLLSGCAHRTPSALTDAVAVEVFNLARGGDPGAFYRVMAPGRRIASGDLARLQRTFPGSSPRSRRTVSYSVVHLDSGDRESLVDEYDFGEVLLHVETTIDWSPDHGSWRVLGFDLKAATPEELARNDLLPRITASPEYLAMTCALVLDLLIVVSAWVSLAREPSLRRQVLFWLAPLVCVGSMEMNWTTGAIDLQLLNSSLLGFGVLRGESRFQPWFVSATLPLGAILLQLGLWSLARERALARKRRRTLRTLDLSA